MVSGGEKLVSDFEQFPNIHPHTFQTLFRGEYVCGYLSDYQHLSASNCYQKYSIAIAIRIICADIKKKTSIIYQIINVFCYF